MGGGCWWKLPRDEIVGGIIGIDGGAGGGSATIEDGPQAVWLIGSLFTGSSRCEIREQIMVTSRYNIYL